MFKSEKKHHNVKTPTAFLQTDGGSTIAMKCAGANPWGLAVL